MYREKYGKKQSIALGDSSTSCFRPRRSGIPHNAITPGKVEHNTPKNEGVGGMLPTCCPPMGREGFTLIATAENYQMTLKKRVSTEPEKRELFRAIFWLCHKIG